MQRMGNIYTMALALCEEHGHDFDEKMEYYESYGYVFSGPHFLVLAEYMDIEGELVLHCDLAIGHGAVKQMLQAIPQWTTKIRFARPSRNRIKPRTYDTERLCRAFGLDTAPLKQRSL